MKLSEKYAARPNTEFPMLFQRILQNTIRDFYRRQKVRSTWTTPISSLVGANADEDYDPLDSIDVENESPYAAPPLKQLERAQVLEFIEKCLQKLPPRQREAFVLRYWEEMDVAEAAEVMGCSEGSVKTHCSRATHTLADALRKLGITL